MKQPRSLYALMSLFALTALSTGCGSDPAGSDAGQADVPAADVVAPTDQPSADVPSSTDVQVARDVPASDTPVVTVDVPAIIDVPVVDVPVVDVPAVDVPVVDVLAIDVPVVDVPVVDVLAIDVPAIDVPAIDIPDVPPVDVVPACPSGQTRCGGACVDTATSIANCGSCGRACTAPANGSATCAAGACGITCNAGYTASGATCADNCATSNGGCATGATCGHNAAGVTCTCRPGDIGDGRTCEEVASPLHGMRLELPCTSAHVGDGCSTSLATRRATILGDAAAIYNVTIRVRGVVEDRTYVGGTTTGYWNVGGMLSTERNYNMYRLEVSHPHGIFHLNAGTGQPYTHAIDYTQTIQVAGGVELILTGDPLDGGEVYNHAMTTRTPIVVPDIPPAPAAFDGQFVQLDVVSVSVASCIPGYTRMGSACVDICTVNNGGCDVNGRCQHDSTGAAVCDCQAPFVGDGRHCLDATALRGLRVELPCTSTHTANDCTVSSTAVTRSITLPGSGSTVYDVRIRVRGVAEERTYSGGTASGFWYTGAATPPRSDGYNIMSLAVSGGPTYHLNAGTTGRTYCNALDYQQTVQLAAGRTVTLTIDGIDGRAVFNRSSASGNPPIVVPSIPPAPAAFDGQFIQIDVVSGTVRP